MIKNLYGNTIKFCIHRYVDRSVIYKSKLSFSVIVHINSYCFSSKGSSTRNYDNMDLFKFTDYNCIGFDLDNTLLRYNLTNLMHMEYEILARYLVDKRKYSERHLLKELTKNDLDFMQKGLILDCEKGNILRIDADGTICKACHGTRLLSRKEIEEIYPEQKWELTDLFCRNMLEAWNGPLSMKMRSLLDYFDIPAGLIFARIIDSLDEEREIQSVKYNVWPDILDALVYMFSTKHLQPDKGIYEHIMENPKKYLRKSSAQTVSWLKKIKKKSVTFLLTGSNAAFANFTANYAIGEDWRSLFDIVICFARKPGFFTENRPFLNVENDKSTNIVAADLKQGEIYSQGNWQDFLKFITNITEEDSQRCLYIGDNLIQDIYVPNAFVHCDTVAVVEEQMSEGMIDTDINHTDEEMLNSDFWGSYFCLKDSHTYIDSFWGHIIKKHAKLCIPNIDIIVQIPLEDPIPCFNKNGNVYCGYYPAIPRNITAM